MYLSKSFAEVIILLIEKYGIFWSVFLIIRSGLKLGYISWLLRVQCNLLTSTCENYTGYVDFILLCIQVARLVAVLSLEQNIRREIHDYD